MTDSLEDTGGDDGTIRRRHAELVTDKNIPRPRVRDQFLPLYIY
jgi:hypothetical protein